MSAKQPNFDRLADLAIRRKEHLDAVALIETEIAQVLGLPGAPPQEKPQRKPRSDAGRARPRPNVLPAETATPAEAQKATEPQPQPLPMANHDPDRDDPGPMPGFLRRDAAKPIAQMTTAEIAAETAAGRTMGSPELRAQHEASMRHTVASYEEALKP